MKPRKSSEELRMKILPVMVAIMKKLEDFRTLQLQQELSTMKPIQPRRINTDHQHPVNKTQRKCETPLNTEGNVKLRKT